MKNIVITGSTRGIGFGLVKRFLEKGCKVIINGTTEEHVVETLKKLKTRYKDAIVYGLAGDTSNYQDMQNLWDFAKEKLSTIDIWINNAGIPQQRRFSWDIDVENYTKLIEVNLIGVMNGSKVAFNGMKEQGYGQIFNMEGFGSDGMKQEKMAIYGTSKRAVRYFTRSLAKEAKNKKVLVGTLSPGMVATDFLVKGMEGESEEEIKRAKKVFNILADKVDTVTTYLSKEILKNKKNNAHIYWLTNRKVMYRFMTAKFIKRNIIE